MTSITYNKKVIFFFCVLLSSCKVNGTYENREFDKEEGEKVTSIFYKLIAQREFIKTYSLFTKRFFTITDTSKLAALYVQIESTCGKIGNYKLSDWKTTIVKGSAPNSEYVYLYIVNREKCKTKETISLKKEDDNIRIISYDVKAY